MIRDLIRALSAERLKLSGTLTTRTMLIAPALVALLQFFITRRQLASARSGQALWENLYENSLTIWALFMLPLLVCLQTALINGLEHATQHWKHLFALPVRRSAIYLAKLLVATGLSLVSTMVLCALVGMIGFGFVQTRPELADAGAVPWIWLARRALGVWVAAWWIIALHHWISIRWSSFTLAVGTGIGATFFALFAASAQLGEVYPWLLPVNSVGAIAGRPTGLPVLLGAVGGLVCALLGCLEYVGRDVSGSERLDRRSWQYVAAGSLLLASLMGGTYALRSDQSPLAQRIARIESGLRHPITIDGEASTMRLAERMKHFDVPGVSVAVIHAGKLEWAKGYGVRANATGAAVTTETLFQAGSISKSIAAVAAMRLVEQGRLELDTDIGPMLTSWQIPDSPWSAHASVTARRLLSHTAGFGVHGFEGYVAGMPVPTIAQILAGAAPANSSAVRIELEPGKEWRYSGGGYTVLQQLMIDRTGAPFAEWVRQSVFEPLAMRSSTLDQPLPSAWADRAAAGHDEKGQMIEGRWRTLPELAAAGLWTTPSDLARFLLAVDASRQGTPKAILTRESVAQMLTRQLGDYGLGFELSGTPEVVTFGHGGANIGYRNLMRFYVGRGEGAVVMTNGDRGDSLIPELMRAIAHEYGWPDLQTRAAATVALTEQQLETFVGRYVDNDTTVTITRDGDVLRMAISTWGDEPRELHSIGPDLFVMREAGWKFRFERDASGRVAAMQAETGRETLTARKVQ